MNKSTTENFQQEQMLTEEQKPMVNTSSPDIGNTNVSGSDVVPKDVFDEVCKTRDKLKEKVKEYYDHISSLEQQRIEMIRLRKKEYFNFIAQLNAIKLFFDVTEKGATHRQKELFSQTAKTVIDDKTEELIKNFNDYRFRADRSIVFTGKTEGWMFPNVPNDSDLPF